jgi:hypothetical protein
LARLIRNPEDRRSTDTAKLFCAPAKLRWAISEAMLVFRTDEGFAMTTLLTMKL